MKAIATKKEALKILYDSEEKINVAVLKSKVYLIDGEIYDFSGHSFSKKYVQCKNINDIRLVKNNKVIAKFVDGVENELAPYEYKLELEKLDSLKEKSLEDEYEYKKFLNVWQPIYKEIQEISEPIKIEKLKAPLLIEDNPNIFSTVELDRENKSIYVYRREIVVKELLEKEVAKYNEKYKGYLGKFDLEFKLSIEKNFEFSKINNDYIFGSKYNFKSIRGPKIKIEEKYQNDKELIAKNVKAIFDRMCLVKLNRVDLQMEKEKILSEISNEEDILKVKRFIKYIENHIK
jgi:hypothetical protein